MVLFKTYLEKGYRPIPWATLTPEEMTATQRRFVNVEISVIPYNQKTGLIFLPESKGDFPFLSRPLRSYEDPRVAAIELFNAATDIGSATALEIAVLFQECRNASRTVIVYVIPITESLSNDFTAYDGGQSKSKAVQDIYSKISGSHEEDIFVKTYISEPFAEKTDFVSDELHTKFFHSYVSVAANGLIVDSDKRLFYLPKRKFQPAAGLWFIGGAMWPNTTPETATANLFKRETKLELPPKRFTLFGIQVCRWANKQKPPQDVGCHTLDYISWVELSDTELQQAHKSMERDEYEPGGLKPYNRGALIQAGARQQIIDLYDHLFPSR